jgi:hypothetical protein
MTIFSKATQVCATGLLLVAYVQHASAQAPSGYMQRLKDAEANVAALPADAWERARGLEKGAVIRSFSSALQNLGTQRAFNGDTQGAIAAFDVLARIGPRPGLKPADAALVDAAIVEDAIAAIVAQARSRRVVLINEAHHMPMHRAFSQLLARELRKIGYQYLACEAFDGPSPKAFPHGYATQYDGHLTRDPVFGGWIAEAIADGWKLVAYEARQSAPGMSPDQRIDEREREQASNLLERIFARDSQAKVLIHVGFGHLYKGSMKRPDGTEMVMMGEHLRRMTGLDMLRVDQTQFYAHPDPTDESPLYARLLAKTGTEAPFVISSKGAYAVLQGHQGMVDMQVVFPRYAFSDANGRPAWLATLAGRTPRDIPVALLPASGRRAILAYRAGEPADAVPADVVLVEAGKPVPKLMLPQGEYRYIVED